MCLPPWGHRHARPVPSTILGKCCRRAKTPGHRSGCARMWTRTRGVRGTRRGGQAAALRSRDTAAARRPPPGDPRDHLGWWAGCPPAAPRRRRRAPPGGAAAARSSGPRGRCSRRRCGSRPWRERRAAGLPRLAPAARGWASGRPPDPTGQHLPRPPPRGVVLSPALLPVGALSSVKRQENQALQLHCYKGQHDPGWSHCYRFFFCSWF